VGTNALETQTNYFLNHWVPNLRGASADKKKAEFGADPTGPAQIIFVDPRRTPTIVACEAEVGADNVLHLAINSGTDLALFNALFTEIAAKGWTDRAFIAASTSSYDDAVKANHTTIEQAAQITGLKPADIRKAVEWIAQPKQGGAWRRTMFAYERTDLGQRQLPHQPGAGEYCAGHREHRPPRWRLRAYGRASGRLCTAGGCACRKTSSLRGPIADRGKGGVLQIWGCDHFKTTLNASEFQAYL
jgi:arsenite oxidase large subunit